LPKELVSSKVTFDDKDAILEANKVLGMIWDANTDMFNFVAKFKSVDQFFEKLKMSKNPEWTKRLILRLSATVYDPLGLIAPYTIRSRIIMQNLWVQKLDWDDTIAQVSQNQWNEWLEDLFILANVVRIPRCLGFKSGLEVQLHVFADASTSAFATCCYTRVFEPSTASREEKVHQVSLVSAKARVAPTKTESVSRLELAGCVIGVRVGCQMADGFGIAHEKVYYWTDSKNCLYWINTPASALKTFVSN